MGVLTHSVCACLTGNSEHFSLKKIIKKSSDKLPHIFSTTIYFSELKPHVNLQKLRTNPSGEKKPDEKETREEKERDKKTALIVAIIFPCNALCLDQLSSFNII